MQRTDRKIHLDILRILAIFFVIFNHTGTLGFQLFTYYETGSGTYFLLMFFTVLCKTAVPVFMMISGALLLNRDISFKDLWLKRIPRFLCVLVVASFAYYLYSIKDNFSDFSFMAFLKQLYSTKASVHLWYLYAYLAMLITLPILSAIAKNLPDKGFYFLIILYLGMAVVSVLDTLVFKTSMCSDLKPTWLAKDVVIYPLIGYFLENRLTTKPLRILHKIIIAAVGLISLIAAILLSYQEHILTGEPRQTYYSFLILFPSAAIYLLTKELFGKHKMNEHLAKVITQIGACTFGVYLIHLIIPFRGTMLTLLYETWHIPGPIACVIYCLVIFTVSVGITYPLKKLPVVKKLI